MEMKEGSGKETEALLEFQKIEHRIQLDGKKNLPYHAFLSLHICAFADAHNHKETSYCFYVSKLPERRHTLRRIKGLTRILADYYGNLVNFHVNLIR